MLATGLENWEEAKVILLFHLAGTVMELLKTAAGSWEYPEPSLLRMYDVPLFTGFMYASAGSYLARVWRVFDFRFVDHPVVRSLQVLAGAIYVNFFLHQEVSASRWGGRFAVVGFMLAREGSGGSV